MPLHRLLRMPDASGPAPDDAAWVERARSGDRAAEEAIYRRHVGYLAGIVTRLVASTSEAEDVLQDTFVIALRELPRLRTGTALRPWLTRIAVSQVHRRFRRRRLLRWLGMDHGDRVDLEAMASLDAGPEIHAQLAELGRALEELSPGPRIAWSLRHVDGATVDEAAEACGCSRATAKRRIGAAWRHLRGRIELADEVIPWPGARQPSPKVDP